MQLVCAADIVRGLQCSLSLLNLAEVSQQISAEHAWQLVKWLSHVLSADATTHVPVLALLLLVLKVPLC